ncbi:MAG: M23 family metallopeptidase [Clostridiales bacterium]|nr:M23 family metallopeptidase [Clostridiales bacterium]
MKKIKISEKGRIAYLCILFLVLAFSLTAWRTSQTARRLMGDTLSSEKTALTTTEPRTVKSVEIPVTNVPDTRENTTEETTLFKPLDYFVSPVDGKVLSHYSNGELIKNERTNDYRTHNGTDFAAEKDADVKAINNGIVTAVYSDALWGTVIEIDHGNRVTAKYCGLNENTSVDKGDKVKSGEKIGTVGAIPIESEKNHIHLEIRSGGVLINPIDIIQ